MQGLRSISPHLFPSENDVSEPRAWTTAATCIVSYLYITRKYEGGKATGHTTVALVWRQHHIFFVNPDNRTEPFWFVCAMDWSAVVRVLKVHI